MNASDVALVVGATGTVASGAVEYLSKEGNGCEVIALSRHASECDFPEGVISMDADLFDKDSLRRVLRGKIISHLYFGAFWRSSAKVDFEDDVRKKNVEMLDNVVSVLNEGEREFQVKHVVVVTGMKYNGFILPNWANMTTPYKEDGPTSKHPGHNYYFDLEDYLPGAARQYGFTWSVVRPHYVIGLPYTKRIIGIASIGSSIGVYATLLKEQGHPLIFPGDEVAYQAKCDGISISELGRMCVWSSTNPQCASQAFNGISSGIPYTWAQMWPRIALYFNMDFVPGGDEAVDLVALLKDREEVWERTQKRYDLVARPLHTLFSVGSTDSFLGVDSLAAIRWDTHGSPEKLLKFGFEFREEKIEMFYRCFEKLEQEKVIPKYSIRASKL